MALFKANLHYSSHIQWLNA